jgi:hypothetical protein
MRKRYALSWLACILAATVLAALPSHATEASVVVSQVQLGNEASAKNEFIEVYNNTSSAVDITDWCLQYMSATQAQTVSQLACFLPENASIHLFLPSYTSAFAISNQLALAMPTLGSDLVFPETLSGTSGYVRLMNGSNAEIDKVGWGAAIVAEGASPAGVPPAGRVLQRKTSSVPILQDTNNNGDDFESALPRTVYSYGSIYEVQDLCRNLDGIQTTVPVDYTTDGGGSCSPPPVDVCSNIAGLQIALPTGYALDSDGACMPDICQNLIGLQLDVPVGLELDATGACVEHDECINLTGVQTMLPDGYKLTAAGDCLLDLLPIRITELLANPYGSDTGNEFIELYNPNDTAVALGLYALKVGITTPKLYSFPVGSHMEPNSYMIFSNSDIPFTLANSTGQVAVMTADNSIVDESLPYTTPQDDMAWALIDGGWQYTSQPTPGATNLASLVEVTDDAAVTSTLVPCASNQYRSPETGRCRLLVAASSVLTPCKDGQYRSEETNRCRSIAVDASAGVSCDVNQERNPETNRCRLIAAADTTTVVCKAGQERNPETNRCRNIVALSAAALGVLSVGWRLVVSVAWRSGTAYGNGVAKSLWLSENFVHSFVLKNSLY